MILYVNGDSHSAGAEAVNSCCFANDDPDFVLLGRRPHPTNLRNSYGCLLSQALAYDFICEAESGSSNQRILRTTYKYLENNVPDLVVIGWASWEREELIIDGETWQFSAGLILEGHPPPSDAVKQRYKEWIVNRENVQQYCDHTQREQWALHLHLLENNIPHVFFNTYSALTVEEKLDWGANYIGPYDHSQSYFNLLKSWGYTTVNPQSYHYGADAHVAWAKYLLNHLTNYINECKITK